MPVWKRFWWGTALCVWTLASVLKSQVWFHGLCGWIHTYDSGRCALSYLMSTTSLNGLQPILHTSFQRDLSIMRVSGQVTPLPKIPQELLTADRVKSILSIFILGWTIRPSIMGSPTFLWLYVSCTLQANPDLSYFGSLYKRGRLHPPCVPSRCSHSLQHTFPWSRFSTNQGELKLWVPLLACPEHSHLGLLPDFVILFFKGRPSNGMHFTSHKPGLALGFTHPPPPVGLIWFTELDLPSQAVPSSLDGQTHTHTCAYHTHTCAHMPTSVACAHLQHSTVTKTLSSSKL